MWADSRPVVGTIENGLSSSSPLFSVRSNELLNLSWKAFDRSAVLLVSVCLLPGLSDSCLSCLFVSLVCLSLPLSVCLGLSVCLSVYFSVFAWLSVSVVRPFAIS